VSEPWFKNKSFAWMTRTSPGIMSPAAKLTHVPGYEMRDWDLSRVAVAQGGRGHRNHRFELRGRSISLGLLDQFQTNAQRDH
jgi:hypothetical protein